MSAVFLYRASFSLKESLSGLSTEGGATELGGAVYVCEWVCVLYVLLVTYIGTPCFFAKSITLKRIHTTTTAIQTVIPTKAMWTKKKTESSLSHPN